MGFLTRILFCIFILGFMLYSYLNQQNRLIRLRLEVPALARQLQKIEAENTRLVYEVEQFENPIHLLELSNQAEFADLNHPYREDILELSSKETCP